AIDNKSEVTNSATVTITVVDDNKKPLVDITSPENDASFTPGESVTIGAEATDSDGAITKVEFFSGNTKLGEDTSSPYSFTWANVKEGNYSITARATDNKSAVTTSAAIGITVSAPKTPAVVQNKPPVVQLISPSNDARFDQGASATLAASAADSDGSVTKVEFFNGATKLGEDTSSPYAYTWSNLPAGTHSIIAKATDNTSGTTTSQTAVINVTAVNKPPLVQLTSPSNNARFNQGQTVTLTASASDSDGSVAKVGFYNGSTLLGEDTSSPYSYNWTNIKAGKYTITAKATDNRSGVTTSSAIAITVVVPNKAPVVQVTSPANNATFTEGQSIPIKATATDSDGSIAKIQFYSGTTLLGEDTFAPYSPDWANAQQGKYEIIAKATDTAGATAAAKVP